MQDIHTHIGQFYDTKYDYHNIFKALKNNGITDVVAGVKLPKNAGEKFPLLGI